MTKIHLSVRSTSMYMIHYGSSDGATTQRTEIDTLSPMYDSMRKPKIAGFTSRAHDDNQGKDEACHDFTFNYN